MPLERHLAEEGEACALLVSPSAAALEALARAMDDALPRLRREYLPSVTELLFRLVRPGRGTVLIHLDSVEDFFDSLPRLLQDLAPRWQVTLVGEGAGAHTSLALLPARLVMPPA